MPICLLWRSSHCGEFEFKIRPFPPFQRLSFFGPQQKHAALGHENLTVKLTACLTNIFALEISVQIFTILTILGKDGTKPKKKKFF